MQNLWLKIIARRGRPEYWPAVAILWLLSCLYRISRFVALLFPGRKIKLKNPVISVGNLTVGGTGKTPFVIKLAQHYLSRSKSVGVVSSGYRRTGDGEIVGTGGELLETDIGLIGDEVKMMADTLPEVIFSVAESKSRAAELMADKYHPAVVIVDDGFQHRRLHRDLDILLLDATVALHREYLLPLGRLREPLKAADRADIIILTRTNLAGDIEEYRRWLQDRFKTKIIAELEFHNRRAISESGSVTLADMADRTVYFFAGIAPYESFAGYLRERLKNIVGERRFADHCAYREKERRLIRNDIARLTPDYVLTTAKDIMKLRNFDFGRELYYLDLELDISKGEKALFDRLDRVAGMT